MTDYKAMIQEHSCKPNQGCGVMTICMCGVAEDMADEIERLREALQSTSKMIELLCKCFDLEPDAFIIHVKANKENGETRVLRSISAQDVLDEARTALGEKE